VRDSERGAAEVEVRGGNATGRGIERGQAEVDVRVGGAGWRKGWHARCWERTASGSEWR